MKRRVVEEMLECIASFVLGGTGLHWQPEIGVHSMLGFAQRGAAR